MTVGEGKTVRGVIASHETGPTESKTLSMRGHFMHENREIPCVPAAEGRPGRPKEATNRTFGMHAYGKSDKSIVPMKLANKGRCDSCWRSRWREGS